MKRSLLAPLPLLLLGGCRSGVHPYVPEPPPKVDPVVTADIREAEAMMPLKVGNVWNYTISSEATGDTSGGQQATVTYRVVSRKPDGIAELVLESDGQAIDRQEWKVTPTALYQVSGGLNLVPFDPPQPLVLLPITPGKTFEWDGKGLMPDGSVALGRAVSKIYPSQPVDTSMGTLSALPVTTHSTFGKGRSDNTSWFRPGLGLVRFWQTTTGLNGRVSVLRFTLTNYALKR